MTKLTFTFALCFAGGALLSACAAGQAENAKPALPAGVPTGPRSTVAVSADVADRGAVYGRCGNTGNPFMTFGSGGVFKTGPEAACETAFPIGSIVRERLLWQAASVSSMARATDRPTAGCQDDIVFSVPSLNVVGVSTEGWPHGVDVYLYDFDLSLEARADGQIVKQATERLRVRVRISNQGVWDDDHLRRLFVREGTTVVDPVVSNFVRQAVAAFEYSRPRPLAGTPPNEKAVQCLLKGARDQAIAGQAGDALSLAFQAADLCKYGCSPASRTSALVLFGTLGARSNRDAATRAFGEALAVDRHASIDPALATPDAVAAFRAAQAILPPEVPFPVPQPASPAPDAAIGAGPTQSPAGVNP